MHNKKQLAMKKLKDGDPTSIIALYQNEIEDLKKQFEKSSCKGCSKGFFQRKIQGVEEAIKRIKSEKRFRNRTF